MNNELPLDTKILVAVSGGVDSVYMLHNLVDRGFTNLGVAHFNHLIRDDSGKDVELVRKLADEYGLPFHYTVHDIPLMAKAKKQSIELTARDTRRKFFDGIMTINEYNWLALGHHADDQAETVLFNFMRGTGVHGLAGMLRIDEKQKIYRPLSYLTKEDIYKSAKSLYLVWNEDSTNHELDNDRAWLRNVIIPLFERRREGTKRVLSDTAERFQDLSDFMKASADKFVKYNDDSFSLYEFMALRRALRAEVLGLLWERYNGSRKDFSNKVVFEVNKWLDSEPQGGTKVYFGSGHLTTNSGRVFFTQK